MLRAGILAFILFLSHGIAEASLQADIIKATNHERAAANTPLLSENSLLSSVAKERAERMAETQNFSHTDVDGRNAWYWLNERGYSFTRAGENIAVNFDDPHETVETWMSSEGHRANILNDTFQEIGVGVAEGLYKGATSTYIVQLFGTPKGEALGTRQEARVEAERDVTTVKTEETIRAQVAAAETATEPVLRIPSPHVAAAEVVVPEQPPKEETVRSVEMPDSQQHSQTLAERFWSLFARWVSFLF